MEKKFKLGVVGAGFMSSAIISGVINARFLVPEQILVSDISAPSLEKLNVLGVITTTNNSDVLNNAEYVLYAVKPQHFLSAVNNNDKISCKKFISIMAGVKKVSVKAAIGDNNVKVARCMPNTPCSVGYGAVGVDLSDFDDETDKSFIKSLFSSFAQVVVLDESKLNAVTGISGSSPAYFYLFIKGLVDAGVKQGLMREDALKLAVNTMIGSGKMIFENSDKSLDELIAAVCSKGGTTIEAINVFNDNGLCAITDEAVSACVKRAEDLENLI